MSPELMSVALVGAHYIADFAGQGDFMAKAKNPSTALPGVPWLAVLHAHAAIHGSAVALITGVWWLFFAETLAHAVIDYTKCRGRISFTQDQNLHLLCKVLWVWIAIGVHQ